MKKLLFLAGLFTLGGCGSGDEPQPDADPIPVPNYTVADPCLTATSSCLESLPLTSSEGRSGNFTFYSSFPILNDTAVWGNLKYAIIILHGQNRDADNYFSHLTETLDETGLTDSTLLVAPHFKSNSQAGPGELFWPTDWRAGAESGNSSVKIGTFAAIDSLLHWLANQERFPFLEKVMVAGHSSGALFTHLYALANTAESRFESGIDYVVANSQYFYYPQDVRFNTMSGTFEEPGDCPDYHHWPYGWEDRPIHLELPDRTTANDQFASRRVTYLLGTFDTATGGTLNTDDCAAVLLGRHRYNRGENMHVLMDQFYPGHAHQRIDVSGIGHDGRGMYQSEKFKELMQGVFH